MVLMENSSPRSANLTELLGRQCSMVIQGVLFAYELRNYVTAFVNLHLTLGVAMNRAHVKAVFRMVELMKAIEQTFHRRSMFIADMLGHVTQSLTFGVLQILTVVSQRVQSDKKYSAKNLDVLAALNLLQTMVHGPATALRRLAFDLGLGVATQSKVFAPPELERLQSLHLKIAAVATLRQSIREACDTSFFFWHTNLVPLYLQDLYENPSEAHRLHYLFGALRDIEPLVKRSQTICSDQVATQFEAEIIDALQDNIVRKLCGDIETDLRLQVHTGVIATPDRNPFKIGLKDLTHFLVVSPIRFFGKVIDIKTLVTHYLDTTFYNLTTVALHDWKSYGLMRNLATQKYGLNMQDSYLPSQQLEQGLDVLMIMRNIHVFVRGYSYNLNNQIFVEKKSNNKFLNTINIRHVANSIRTHGTGIMNTTVNFTYQFLAKKFFMFSQFLFDDHIKSRLLKDVRYFREIREKTDQRYPYDRAEKFTKIIRKLGTNAAGATYAAAFVSCLSVHCHPGHMLAVCMFANLTATWHTWPPAELLPGHKCRLRSLAMTCKVAQYARQHTCTLPLASPQEGITNCDSPFRRPLQLSGPIPRARHADWQRYGIHPYDSQRRPQHVQQGNPLRAGSGGYCLI